MKNQSLLLVLFLLILSCNAPQKNSETGEETTENEVYEEIAEEEAPPEEAAESLYPEFIEWVAEEGVKGKVVPEKYKEYVGNRDELVPIDLKQISKNGLPTDAIIFRKDKVSPEDRFHFILAVYEEEQNINYQPISAPNAECLPKFSFLPDSKDLIVEILEDVCDSNTGKKTYLDFHDNEWEYDFVDVEYMNLADNLSPIGKIFLNIPALLLDVDTKKKALLYQQNQYARQLRSIGSYGVFNVMDAKNGYLNFSPGHGAMIEYEVTMSIVYWNLGDGKKLVGFASIGCDMLCSMEALSFFYTQDGETFEQVDQSKIIPELTMTDFLNDPDEGAPCIYAVLYELPRNGKNIRAYIESDCPTKLVKGTQVMLNWNGGSFALGEFKNSES